MIYRPDQWKKLIAETGMPGWKFAAKYQIIHSHFSAMCNGRKDPQFSTVIKVSEAITQERQLAGLPL